MVNNFLFNTSYNVTILPFIRGVVENHLDCVLLVVICDRKEELRTFLFCTQARISLGCTYTRELTGL